ncbi:MAG: ABC-ATPase UvrA, partial [Aeoliella sp.]
MMKPTPISVRGARTHNLNEVDLDLPRGKLIVFCGVSGSGKTSMAIDTLHAEGQRRYIESFSAYTRQFLQQLDKPDVDRIDGVPPTIAITRAGHSRSNRTTVATATEVADYLRLLFARVGQVQCVQCGERLDPHSPESIAAELATLPEQTRLLIAFPAACPVECDREAWRAECQEAGFVRVVIAGQLSTFDDMDLGCLSEGDEALIVVDRLVAGGHDLGRAQESLETAFGRGDGACTVLDRVTEENDVKSVLSNVVIGDHAWQRRDYQLGLHCANCNLTAMTPEPRLFDFNSPLGACTECEGLGSATENDSQSRGHSSRACPACGGARLRREALAVRVGGRHLAELYALSVREALAWFDQLSLDDTRTEVARPVLADIVPRLGFLTDVGVGYLTLNRPLRTLSTGEAQRVAMTATLGSSLVDMLYVLDEPTAGLHRTDAARLLASIKQLRDRGNTVLVVEHEETLITGCDHVVEFGPQAGTAGGRIVFQGTPEELQDSGKSATGDWLAGRRILGSAENRRPAESGRLQLVGARGNNLRNLTVDFPLGLFAAVTGVSGAGKSTLVQQTLYPALAERLQKSNGKQDAPPLEYDDLFGGGQLEDVVLIDQSPVTRSSRSNPVTYVKAFDPIRGVFAEQSEARARGMTASHFSFNVEGGRCERCAGTGQS